MPLINTWKIEKVLERSRYLVRGLIHGKKIKVYWWSSRKNFGDLLTPRLLLAYGYTPVYTKKNKASLVSTGSILDGLSRDYTGAILGSGLIRDTELALPHAQILAVRGQLTRDRLGLPVSTPLGDPGLLAAKLLPDRPEKKYRLGVIPHYVDKNNTLIPDLVRRYRGDTVLIDPEQYPETVIRLIAECETILSSSLHGIIVAHALHIPAAWMSLSEGLAGGSYKFKDYASSLDIDISPIQVGKNSKLEDFVSGAVLPEGAVTKRRIETLDKIFLGLEPLCD
jgi:pyruvyltransferase